MFVRRVQFRNATRQRSAFAASPELRRLREKLASEDAAIAARGATMLLELVEPDGLDHALEVAFEGAPVARHRRRVLERAWEDYRHDRYRSVT